MNEKFSFNPRLESLRGIAALGVAFTHSQMVFDLTSPVSYPVLAFIRRWLFIGLPSGGSVIVFFVLSGHVLARAVTRERSAMRFIVRRLFRIFPALWVGVAVTFAAEMWLSSALPKDQFHPWFQSVFLNNPTWGDFFANLVLLKVDIDQVTWSLVPEVIWSLLLPVGAWLHARANAAVRWMGLAALFWAGYFSNHDYILFAAAFYAGFFVPREWLAPLIARPVVAITVSLTGWALLCYGNIELVAYTPPMRLFCTIAAVLVVSGVAAGSRALRFLEFSPFRFLGRVSYSFYLLHLPVLLMLSALVFLYPVLRPESMLGGMVLGITSIAAAIGLSALSHSLVELPTIELGRRVAAYLADLRPLAYEAQ